MRKVLIYGISRSGQAAAELALKDGDAVFLYDDSTNEKTNNAVMRLSHLGASDCRQSDILSFLSIIDTVVLSPSITVENPVVKQAKQLKKTVISELEFAASHCVKPLFAVTGTNGKTTTSSMVSHILSLCGASNALTGNIGVPLSQSVDAVNRSDYGVVEVSSFMLENIVSFAPKAAAVLNIQPDHLDRHKSLEAYADIKFKIFSNQTNDDYSILNADDSTVTMQKQFAKGNQLFFSLDKAVDGAYARNGWFYYFNKPICKTSCLKLIGRHNLQNALCALCFANIAGIDGEGFGSALSKFNGVKHRLQLVRVVGGIKFYNDSKATNIASTLAAVSNMDTSTVLILGGSDKGENFDNLVGNLNKSIKTIIVYGSTAPQIIDSCKRFDKNYQYADGLTQAVTAAKNAAQKGWNVLFSPSCASFDMFENFEHRGDEFVKAVNAL